MQAVPEKLNFISRDSCPACGASASCIVLSMPFCDERVFRFLESYYGGRLSKLQLAEAEFRVACCSVCTLHYQVDILTDLSMEFLYEYVISADESRAKRENASLAYFKSLLRDAALISEFFDVKQPRKIKVLDFGMGWGHWAVAARALGYDAVGAELSAIRIAFAAKNGIASFNIDDIESDSFDYIHTDQVFEHLAEPHPILQRLVQLMKPGAVLKIQVPDGSRTHRKFTSGWRASKDELHPLEHINAFTYKSLVELAARSGLTPVPAAGLRTVSGKLRYGFMRLRKSNFPYVFFRKST